MSPEIERRLKILGFSDLENYYLSDLWFQRKKLYYQSHPRTCYACGFDRMIDLHHISYDRVGGELDEDLIPLCRNCHAGLHIATRTKRVTMRVAHDVLKDQVETQESLLDSPVEPYMLIPDQDYSPSPRRSPRRDGVKPGCSRPAYVPSGILEVERA